MSDFKIVGWAPVIEDEEFECLEDGLLLKPGMEELMVYAKREDAKEHWGETRLMALCDVDVVYDLKEEIEYLREENDALTEQRDEHVLGELRYEKALRRIVNMDIPVGVGAECADWLKGVAQKALDDVKEG